MLTSIPPYLSVSQFMGYIKSKSALMIFDRHAHLKYRYGKRNFWAGGDFVDTVGKNEKVITEYIRNQLQEDYISNWTNVNRRICKSIYRRKERQIITSSLLEVMILRATTFWFTLINQLILLFLILRRYNEIKKKKQR